MHKKVIQIFKKLLKKNNIGNIIIDELIKKDCYIINEEIFIELPQDFIVTPKQLKVLEKLSNGITV